MWPIALWALYSWRRQLDRTQILLPSLFLAAIVFAGFFIRYDAAGNLLLISIAPTCVLAAFGLASLRRSREIFGLVCAFGLYRRIAHGLALLACRSHRHGSQDGQVRLHARAGA
mgnify:FL=1